jgi:hypothetical protein
MGAEVVFILIDKYGVSNNIKDDKLGIDFRVIPMTRYQKIISHCRIDALGLENVRSNFKWSAGETNREKNDNQMNIKY